MRTPIDSASGSPTEQSPDVEHIREDTLRRLVLDAVSPDLGLSPLRGFKMDLSANPGFLKVFFAARCECTTVALLSVEASAEKTVAEVERALPSLVGRLEAQARAFYNMNCEMHERMRLGPAAGGPR